MCYKGYDKVDDIINTCAGVAGLGICLFPCYVSGVGQYVGTFWINIETSDIVHCACAAVFFGLLSVNSLFRFTKSSGEMTKNKKIRNVIYRVCGVGMLGSFSLFLFPNFPSKVWLLEAIALFFFGISFLTKADRYPWLFADTPSDLVTQVVAKVKARSSNPPKNQ
jgi:hypothetical protein